MHTHTHTRTRTHTHVRMHNETLHVRGGSRSHTHRAPAAPAQPVVPRAHRSSRAASVRVRPQVWSHVVGAGWALWRAAELVHSVPPAHPLFAPVLAFLASAFFCFGASATAHALAPVLPPRASAQLWAIDSVGVRATHRAPLSRASRAPRTAEIVARPVPQVGISMGIGGSFFPGLAFGFRCLPRARRAYTLVVIGLLAASAVLALKGTDGATGPQRSAGAAGAAAAAAAAAPPPGAARSRRDRLRVASLVAAASFGVVPLVHYCAAAPPAERALLVPPVFVMFGPCARATYTVHRQLPAPCAVHTVHHSRRPRSTVPMTVPHRPVRRRALLLPE